MHLIILTKKWGRNYTGATLATQYFSQRWYKNFESVNVYTLHIGESISSNSKINIVHCRSEKDIKNKIKHFVTDSQHKEIIGYSDDHLGHILHDCNVKYVHTYHGNWPDAKKTNFLFFLKSFYFIPLYKKTIQYADVVVNVSNYMRKFTDLYNKNSVVIRNGMDLKIFNGTISPKNGFLMVGNVDKRKYKLCVKLCEKLNNLNTDVNIDIYGRIEDKKLQRILEKYSNVHFMGMRNEIPYKNYLGMINSSCIENLSISVCEALANEVPVVCFNVGGLSEVVCDGENGFLIEQFDVQSMVEKLQLLQNGYILPNCRFENALEFNWDFAAKKYMQIFEGQCTKK